jgi:L-alanine-DL-glutamate epimerase-like enolase superfamily enzyme
MSLWTPDPLEEERGGFRDQIRALINCVEPPHANWLEYQDWAAPILERSLELKDGFALPRKEAGGGLAWDKDAVAGYRVC